MYKHNFFENLFFEETIFLQQADININVNVSSSSNINENNDDSNIGANHADDINNDDINFNNDIDTDIDNDNDNDYVKKLRENEKLFCLNQRGDIFQRFAAKGVKKTRNWFSATKSKYSNFLKFLLKRLELIRIICGHGLVGHRSLLHSWISALPSSADVHQSPGPGGGAVQVGHVPEV